MQNTQNVNSQTFSDYIRHWLLYKAANAGTYHIMYIMYHNKYTIPTQPVTSSLIGLVSPLTHMIMYWIMV